MKPCVRQYREPFVFLYDQTATYSSSTSSEMKYFCYRQSISLLVITVFLMNNQIETAPSVMSPKSNSHDETCPSGSFPAIKAAVKCSQVPDCVPKKNSKGMFTCEKVKSVERISVSKGECTASIHISGCTVKSKCKCNDKREATIKGKNHASRVNRPCWKTCLREHFHSCVPDCMYLRSPLSTFSLCISSQHTACNTICSPPFNSTDLKCFREG